MLGRIIKIGAFVSVIAGAAAVTGYVRLNRWAEAPRPLQGAHVLNFKQGTSLAALGLQLEQEGLVDYGLMFRLWVRMSGSYPKFQAGRYRFEGSTTPLQIEDAMSRGETFNPVVLQFTIPEGFTLRAVADRLAANAVGHPVEIRRLMSDPAFLKSLNVTAPSLEGYLYPATYAFHDMPTAAQALEQMVKTFWQNLPKDYERHVQAMGLSLNDAVTFASLIEMETMDDEEKPLISEVIWRRLKEKIPLAIDAALIYGIPDYAGDLKWAHLSDASNPYNTRIHIGLPPSPIGAPGTKSLEAVLTPANFGYYYYVLMPGGTRHHFSKTLKEHNEHVKKLLNGSKRSKK